jgi:hypothetical protein
MDVQSLGKLHRRVFRALRKGRKYAKSADRICREARVPEERRTQLPTRAIIRELIKSGFPVLSCSRGFYLPTKKEDIDEYVGSLYSRQGAIQERIDRILSAAKAVGLTD